MEGPYLPEGSGGEEPPEEPNELVCDMLALMVYNARMEAFEAAVLHRKVSTVRKRRQKGDYTTKNCEEAYGRGGGSEADDGVG